MTIEYLADHITCAETAAKWIFDEFINGIKIDRTYETVLSSMKNCHKKELPIRLIAMIDGKCAGTVSLVSNDLKCRNYTPWLAGLYVDKALRNQKIGRTMIDRIKIISAELGYKELFLRTEHAGNYYRKLGWEYIETCDDDYNLKPDVFKWKLQIY